MNAKRIKLFLILLTALVFSAPVARAVPNGNSWQLLSPAQGKIIKSGQLFISIKLLDSVKVIKGSLQILIDDNLITNFVKFSENNITVLYIVPMNEGKHKIEINARSIGVGEMNSIKSTFTVNKFSGPDKDSVIVKKADFFELSGIIGASNKQTNYSGPGAAAVLASPNVPYIRDFNADFVARIGKVSFLFKSYNTSDAYLYPPGIQSRNYLQYGIRYGGLEFLYGDQTPVFDKLVLSGIRVKGWAFTYTEPKFKVQIVNGVSEFKQEGQVIRYHASDSTPVPAGLRPDSTYIIPGIYQRQLTAARISYGSPFEGSVISLNFLRSRDDTTSILHGANAMDNFVAGADESFTTNGNKMRVNAGFAISALTTDTRGGPATESQVDSLYGYKVGIDPEAIKSFFVINATTVKPDQPSTADYITAVFKSDSKNKQTENLLTMDYHYYGGSYTSFGNPFVLNDLWAGTLQDQLAILNREIVLSGRYTYQENNVSASQLTTLTTQIINSSAIFAFSPKLPQISIYFNNQTRNTPGNGLTDLVETHDNSLNISGIISYNLKTRNSLTNINASYTGSSRSDVINPFTDNATRIVSGGVNHTFLNLNLGIDLRYAATYYSNPEITSTLLSSSYEVHVRYELKNMHTNVSVGTVITSSNAVALLGSSYSERSMYNISINSRIIKGFLLSIEAGLAPYTDLQNSFNSYMENYTILRLQYVFDLKR